MDTISPYLLRCKLPHGHPPAQTIKLDATRASESCSPRRLFFSGQSPAFLERYGQSTTRSSQLTACGASLHVRRLCGRHLSKVHDRRIVFSTAVPFAAALRDSGFAHSLNCLPDIREHWMLCPRHDSAPSIQRRSGGLSGWQGPSTEHTHNYCANSVATAIALTLASIIIPRWISWDSETVRLARHLLMLALTLPSGHRLPHPLHLRPALQLLLPYRHLHAVPAKQRLRWRRPLLLLHVAERGLPDELRGRDGRHDAHRFSRHDRWWKAEARERVAGAWWLFVIGGVDTICRDELDCEYTLVKSRRHIGLTCGTGLSL